MAKKANRNREWCKGYTSANRRLTNKIKKIQRHLNRVAKSMLKREHRNEQGKGRTWKGNIVPHIIREDAQAVKNLERINNQF